MRWTAGLLLVALVFRAWIPQGFMPAADAPFTLQICPEGFPTQLLTSIPHDHGAHHGHEIPSDEDARSSDNSDTSDTHLSGHRSDTSQHCVFTATAGNLGPASDFSVAGLEKHFSSTALSTESAGRVTARPHRSQQPRAPPVFS